MIAAIAIFLPVVAHTEYNEDCLQRAIDRRSDAVKAAYRSYSDEMIRLHDDLSREQHNAAKVSNVLDRRAALSTAQARYTNALYRASERVNRASEDAWIEYAETASVCEGYPSYIQYSNGYYQYYQGYPDSYYRNRQWRR